MIVHSATWGRAAAKSWWLDAQQRTVRPFDGNDGTVLCNPVVHISWFGDDDEDSEQQLRNCHSLEPPLPSILRTPGPGVINSAARTLAAARTIRWERVRSIAEELELNDDRDASGGCDAASEWVVDTICDGRGDWRVMSARSLEHVIAHALCNLDSPTRLWPKQLDGSAPTRGELPMVQDIPLDQSALYYEYRQRGQRERVTASTLSLHDGWGSWDAVVGQGMLSPHSLMLSRASEPVCWPKVWHFSSRMAVMSDAERLATFGHVPVRWVSQARRWACGNRHRLFASLLLGRDLPVRVQSGSQRPGTPDAS